MNLFDIAVRNIKKNLSNYFLYFVSMVCSIMIFYILKAIQYNRQIMDMSNLNDKIENAFGLISGVIALFALVFVWYSNTFFTGRRKKEIALYCLLGVKKSQVAKMLFYENLVMGGMALLAGILSGVVFSRLFAMVLVKLMGFNIVVKVTIPVDAVVSTIVIFLILFVITSFHGYLLIYKYQLIDLFKSESKSQKQPKTSLILTLIAILLIGSGYWGAFHFKYNGMKSILPIVLMTVCGTYLLFSSFVVYIVKGMKAKKALFYKELNMITFSHLLFRSKSNSRLLATIAVLSACTLTAVGAAAVLYYDNVTGIDRILPFSYVYQIKNNNLDKKIEEVINRHTENKLMQSLTAEVKQVEGNCPTVDKIHVSKNRYEKSVDQVISVSTLQKILRGLGKDASVKLDKAEVMMYFYKIYPEKVMENPEGKTMYYRINKQEVPFKIKECVDYPVINKLFNKNNSIVNVIVVEDSVYEKLEVKEPPSLIRLIKIKNQKASKETTDEIIKTMSQSRVYNQNSYGKNALNISSYYDEYMNMMAELGMTIFLVTFVGIVFLICTGSMIFFKQLSEASEDRKRYNILKKIGVSRREAKLSIAKQMSIIFGLPLVVGVSHSMVALRILEPLVNSNIWYPVITVSAAYLLIYFLYYLLTVHFYYKSL